MEDDPVIQRVRAARHRISEKCDHDPTKLVNYYIELQKRYEDRLLKPEKDAPKKKRIAGLHEGAIEVADDFDAPLPEEFWLGKSDEYLQERAQRGSRERFEKTLSKVSDVPPDPKDKL